MSIRRRAAEAGAGRIVRTESIVRRDPRLVRRKRVTCSRSRSGFRIDIVLEAQHERD